MITLAINSSNTFVVDCSPNVAVDGIFYFEFIHDQQQTLFEITLEDNSPYPDSYNLFILDLTTELQSMVKLGDYEYKIYDSEDKDNLVAIGKMVLTAPPREEKTNEVTTGNNKIHEDRSI
jgi:hypothetical protein